MSAPTRPGLLVVLAALSLVAACSSTAATPMPTLPAATPTPTPVMTPAPTTTPVRSPTAAPTATEVPTATAAPSAAASPVTSPPASVPASGAPSVGPVSLGTARVQTTGDVGRSLLLTYDSDSEFPVGDGSFDMKWVDESSDSLLVTLDIAGGKVTSAFVAVGVPGNSIVDPDYFPDFFRSQCNVTVAKMDATSVDGTFTCSGLENSDGTKSVDASGGFSAAP